MPPKRRAIKESNLDDFDWDNNKKFDLIKEVRARDQLWDHLRSDFSKRDVTDKNWREVGDRIGCRAEEAKEIWSSLKVYYGSLKRKMAMKKSGQGLDDFVVPKWTFYGEMDFLSSKGKPRESISSMDDPKEKERDDYLTEDDVLSQGGQVFYQDDIDGVQVHFEQVQNHLGTSTSSSASSSPANELPEHVMETPTSVPCSSKRQKKRPSDTDESSAMVELMSTVSTAIKTKSVASADELFAQQVQLHLQSLPESMEKERLKIRIMTDIVNFKFESQ